MIVIHFGYGQDIIQVRIDGITVKFASTAYGAKESDIEGLKLSKSGAVAEFPDLKDKDNWKKLVVERFKRKVNKIGTEEGIMTYVVSELSNHGYIPIKYQKNGFRPRKF